MKAFLLILLGFALGLLAVFIFVCLLVYWKHKDGGSGISD